MSFCRLVTADVESDIVAPHWVVDEVADGMYFGRNGKGVVKKFEISEIRWKIISRKERV